MLNPLPTPFDREAVLALLAEHSLCLDEGRIDQWPDLFVDDGIYRVLSRENVELGLPAPLVYYYSRGMMRDRVTALRDALTFEPVYTRHMISDIRLSADGAGQVEARSNFAIYQTTEEGVTRLFAVGGYRDVITATPDGPRFRERCAIVDTFGVQNLIALPL
ncbi:aromatic-ring-hydroxylating dioxygenase subunit beta [Sphingomonas colocasiae]|uniref:Aromatic-ring-hydroxylating dioxygenase subunit beta n=1 Tax=Sphingomonas colocasiae TaxID=1848973 RepID=A0ABS7PND5_9SPHN|nr:aromatic-ring-hydroxylating dioxygenase subunit beta [Sphingomonas colocasiae]MBY8821957.1 aromatic-ring-hydroxylating dioxygenase subunit beta [Sphingomonas colocasiae]